MQHKALLLSLLVVLVLIRFVVQPLWEWQQQSLEQISLFAKREHRSQQVLAQQSTISNAVQGWQQLSQQVSQLYPKYNDNSQAQLSAQQAIQQQVTTQKARFELFDWLMQPNIEASGVQRAIVKLRVVGSPEAIAALHADLASKSHLRVLNSNFTWQNQLTVFSTVTANFDLLYHYQLTEQG